MKIERFGQKGTDEKGRDCLVLLVSVSLSHQSTATDISRLLSRLHKEVTFFVERLTARESFSIVRFKNKQVTSSPRIITKNGG